MDKRCCKCLTHSCHTLTPAQLPHTHTGGNVKVEDDGSNILHVVIEELHHCVHGNHRAMDGNSHVYSASGRVLSQSISHSCNEEGLPHPRPGGTDHSYTGTVHMCVRVWREVLFPKLITSMFTSCQGKKNV